MFWVIEYLCEVLNECMVIVFFEVDFELLVLMSFSLKSEGGFILFMLKMVGGINSLDQ